jgi:penicillin-insensitive murein endopeptidase
MEFGGILGACGFSLIRRCHPAAVVRRLGMRNQIMTRPPQNCFGPAAGVISLVLLAVLFVPASAQKISGDDAKRASRGPSRVIGIYANGCIAGARRLPPTGRGYTAIRLQRNRNWGHPKLVRFVTDFGRWVDRRYGRVALVADLSAPRGGPISGHASHEVGLDADIRFVLKRSGRLSRAYRARPPEVSMLTEDKKQIDSARWSGRQIAMLRYAARYPGVDRIFVNPVIKRALCRQVKGQRGWLRKVVPWFGHHAHMHVRMTCPADSPQCIKQLKLPKGTGCGWRVRRWFVKILPAWRKRLKSGTKPKRRPPPELPTACLILFNQ